MFLKAPTDTSGTGGNMDFKIIEDDDDTLHAIYRYTYLKISKHIEIETYGRDRIFFYELWAQIMEYYLYYLIFRNIGKSSHCIKGMSDYNWPAVEVWIRETRDCAMRSKPSYQKWAEEYNKKNDV